MINGMIVNFPFLDGDVPRSPYYGVYILQLIRFARVCYLLMTAKLLKQGYRYHVGFLFNCTMVGQT